MAETIIQIPGKLVAKEYGTKLANASDLDNDVYGPYASVSAAHAALQAKGLNTVGTTVGISGSNNTVVEYWYQGGTEQANLVEKSSGGGGSEQIQSDWNQTDSTKKDFIKNKPNIPDTSDYYTKSQSDSKYQPKGKYQPAGNYATKTELNGKVDKVSGKGLSTNDYTNEDKAKVAAALVPADIAGKANASDVYTKSETYNKTELNNMITTPNQEYVTVTATSQTTDVTTLLPAPGNADTIYRVGNWDGTQYDDTCYSEYAWKGETYVKLSTKNVGIDDEPTTGSNNLVKSGGVTKDFGLLERRTLYSKTINLYNKDSIENRRGAYLDKNGIWHTLAGMLVTPFIPVIEDETYYISGRGATVTMRFVTAYDAEYNVLPEKGADNTGTVNSYTCPSGVSYIRITIYTALKDVMICATNGASYAPFDAITTKELYEQKLNKNAVINTFTRNETDVLSSDASGLLIAKTANKKITRFSQVSTNQIASSFYTWGKDRFCGYVKQTDSYTYKIMIYQYDANKSLIGYGTIWPKNYTFDNAIPNAVYFKVQVLRRNADDTADVPVSVDNLSGFEIYTNYEDNDLDGLTKLDNNIFTLRPSSLDMLTKAVCKWSEDNVSIKCRGSITTKAMIYQYDKDFNSLGYTNAWNVNYTDTQKEGAVYFDIRVAKYVDGNYAPIDPEDLEYIEIYSNYVPYNKNLTINVLGDSLTAEGNVTSALQKFGYKINNYGVSGTSMAGTGSTSFISRFYAMTDDCDIVLVLGGVNDWRVGVYMGSFDSVYNSDDPLYGNTFYSALHILCSGLKNKYTNNDSRKLVIFGTPMHNQFSLEGYPDLPEFVIENNKIVAQSYGNGKTLKEYVEAIKKVCEYYAIPVIDLYARSYVAPIQDDNKTKYTNDGLHPNTAGGKLMAEAIMRELIFSV